MGDFAAARARLFKSPLTAAEGAALAAEQAKTPIPTKEEHDMSSKLEQLQATEDAAAKSLEAAVTARTQVQSAEAARVAQITAAWWEAASQAPDVAGAPDEMRALTAAFVEAVRSGDGGAVVSAFVKYKTRGFELYGWLASVEAATGQPAPVVSVTGSLDQMLDVALNTVASDALTAYRAGRLAELDAALA